jgi:hypothetical protein
MSFCVFQKLYHSCVQLSLVCKISRRNKKPAIFAWAGTAALWRVKNNFFSMCSFIKTLAFIKAVKQQSKYEKELKKCV